MGKKGTNDGGKSVFFNLKIHERREVQFEWWWVVGYGNGLIIRVMKPLWSDGLNILSCGPSPVRMSWNMNRLVILLTGVIPRKRMGEGGIQKKSLLLRSNGIQKKSRIHHWWSDPIPPSKAIRSLFLPIPNGTKKSWNNAIEEPKKKRSNSDKPMPRLLKSWFVQLLTASILNASKKPKEPHRNSRPEWVDHSENANGNEIPNQKSWIGINELSIKNEPSRTALMPFTSPIRLVWSKGRLIRHRN